MASPKKKTGKKRPASKKKAVSVRKSPGVSKSLPLDERLRNGLSSHRSYVMLAQKDQVALQFKPFLERMNPAFVYLGGKLSLFVDDGSVAEKNPERIRARFKALSPDRVNERRVGSNAGVQAMAGVRDKEAFEAKIPDLTESVLNSILSKFKIKLSRGNYSEILEWLCARYVSQVGYVFHTGGSSVVMSPRLVGRHEATKFGQTYSEFMAEAVAEKLLKKYKVSPTVVAPTAAIAEG